MLHMEQISYRYEIILNLINKNNHLRQIAKDIGTNHMAVKRILDDLIKGNILDVKVEGRNNIYSIKKTLEAQNTVNMAESYKFNKLIKKHPELKQDLGKLRKINSKLMIIFGSYAKFNERKDSDIDIYLETEDNKIKQAVSQINKNFSVKIGKYNKSNLLIKEIEKSHIIIKGLERFYEKNRFFAQT